MSNIHVFVTDWYCGIIILISQIKKPWQRGPVNFLGQIDVESMAMGRIKPQSSALSITLLFLSARLQMFLQCVTLRFLHQAK